MSKSGLGAGSIKAVLFDFDGTIVQHSHVLLPARLAGWGHPRPLDAIDRSMKAHIEYFYEDQERWDDFYLMYRWLLSDLQIPDPMHQLADQIAAYFNERPLPPLFDDFKPLLDHLNAANYMLGVITQRDHQSAYDFLKGHDLQDHFSIIIGGDDGYGRKPTLGPFQAALDHLGCAPEEAAFVGDRIDDDCEGAANAGLHAFLIDRDQEQLAEAAARTDFVHLASLLELRDYLPHLNR